jgi:hypothetical protein
LSDKTSPILKAESWALGMFVQNLHGGLNRFEKVLSWKIFIGLARLKWVF